MIEEKDMLDEVSFEIRRKGYDVDEVDAYIEDLQKKYITETLKANSLNEIIDGMEKVIKKNLEEAYDENKSLLDNMLDIVLENKKQRYQLEDKKKQLDEMQEKLGSFENVQSKVMGILASAQEFRKEAEEKANAILERAQQEAQGVVEKVRKEAENRCVEYNQKNRDVLEKTRKEVMDTYGKMKGIMELYFSEVERLSEMIEQLRAEHRRSLQLQLEKLQEEGRLNGVENKVGELKDSIRHLEDIIDETLGETKEEQKEQYPKKFNF